MRTRSLVLVAAVGLALGAIGTWLVLTSDHLENKAAFLALALTVGLSFLVSGVIALWRRPDNRTGFLLVLVAYLWFLGGLTESDNDWVFTIGVLVNSLALGRVRPAAARVPDRPAPGAQGPLARGQHIHARLRRLPRAAAGRRAAGLELRDAVRARSPSPAATPPTRSSAASSACSRSRSSSSCFAIVVTRYLRARGALRRALGPVLGTGALVMVVLFVQLVVDTVSEDAADPLYFVFLVTFALVPVAFLAGVLRSRLARSGVADLLVELGRGIPIRDALAHSLGDPSLDLVYWLPEREQLVLPDGSPFQGEGRHPRCDTTSDGTASWSGRSSTTRRSRTSPSSSTRSRRRQRSGSTTNGCRPSCARSSPSSRRS